MILRWLLLGFFSFGFVASPTAQTLALITNDSIYCKIDKKNNLQATHYITAEILNSVASEMFQYPVYYDDMTSLEELRVSIVDKNNREVKTYKRSDFIDSPISQVAFFDKGRAVLIQVNHDTYPYEINLIYTTKATSFFYFPKWVPQYHPSIPTLQATYVLDVPIDYTFNSGFVNLDPVYSQSSIGKTTIHKWKTNFIGPKHYEPMSVPYTWLMPAGYFSPKQFTYANTPGSFNRWDEFGQWIYNLGKDKQSLPITEQNRIKALAANASTVQEKVDLVYEDFQKNNRYINIVLEEGGYVPFDASFVCEKRYGDCKALTNYMVAALNSLDIEAYYCLINAGSEASAVDSSIHTTQFNHVILMVPNQGDTLWVECTSNHLPLNYMGSFTEDRLALVAKPEGSRLVRTPVNTPKNNITSSRFKLTLQAEYPQVDGTILQTGINAEEDFFMHHGSGNRRLGKYIEKEALTYGLTEANLQLNCPKRKVESNRNVTGFLHANVTRHGKTIIIPQVYKVLKTEPIEVPHRTLPLLIVKNEQRSDTTVVLLEGLTSRNEAFEKEITSKYGTFNFKIELTSKALTVTKSLIWKKGIYPSGDYADYVNFLKEIEALEAILLTFEFDE